MNKEKIFTNEEPKVESTLNCGKWHCPKCKKRFSAGSKVYIHDGIPYCYRCENVRLKRDRRREF